MITIVAFYTKALDDFYEWESTDKKSFQKNQRSYKRNHKNSF